MRGIVVRTVVAVVLGTGAWWGGSTAALAADAGPGPAVVAASADGHGTRPGTPGSASSTGSTRDLGDLLDLDGRGDHHGGRSDWQCSVTTAWGDSWCPRKPLD
ncbi:hypothetical protein ACIQ9P_00925 [Kitasatospora sp. NPDC094019]|uniref:hypothetical protein n=1 Tax=Kitasatospora sp. NPDC094019 TaxID=3364091 RepID=UPI003814AB92